MNMHRKNFVRLFVFSFVVMSSQGFAQSKKIRPLAIGDPVPDMEFSMMNYKSPTARLSDFKGKLVILDFWASWCYSCLHKFPKMDELQKKYNDKLQVIAVNSIPVTGDDQKKVNSIVDKYTDGKSFSVPVSYNDSVASKLFPYYSMPHYVWITPDGEVKGMTDADAVNSSNIDAVLQDNNDVVALPVKKDYFPNRLLDLSTDDVQPLIDEGLTNYVAFRKGKIDRLNSVNSKHTIPGNDNKDQIDRGIALRNVSLMQLFETANNYSGRKVGGYFDKRVFLQVKDPSAFKFDPGKTTKEKWENENLYTYDKIVPEPEMKNMDKWLWQDLNTYTGYNISIEKKSMPCYEIFEKGTATISPLKPGTGPSISTKDGVCEIANSNIDALTNVLDSNPKIDLPVITKITRDSRFNIRFDYDHFDLKKMNEVLKPFGLEMKKSKEEMNVLVVTDKTAAIPGK